MIARAAPDERCHVVGIGASAGGLEALKAFFGAMPAQTGLAFVVVVHLDPAHHSLMPELIDNVTGLTVVPATDRQRVSPDHVYVIPPNCTLTIAEGTLRVREAVDRRALRGVVDGFFRSLAEDQQDRAIAIVLSGTGTEGTLGVRSVKAHGGLTLAQAPDTAGQPGMPASAIDTGLIDVVDAPARLPKALLAYLRGPRVDRPGEPPLDDIATVLDLLQTRSDFRGYKRSTLQRRIERRMGLRRLDSIADYIDVLRTDPAAVDQLVRDLRIGVTSFFRDPEVFDELASSALSVLRKAHGEDVPLRIWVPGCSTGEEAYSIAMVVFEQLSATHLSRRIQIFASDVDAHALAIARAGSYPESIALDVSPRRLQRFFTHGNHRYTIAKSIRDSIVFATQNLVSDPPFSKLDLVSCRNVLIYFEPDVQIRMLRLLHFALNPGGYLLLGRGEGIGDLNDLFTPVSGCHVVFQRLGPVVRAPVEFPVRRLGAADADRIDDAGAAAARMASAVDQRLLQHFAPAAVVVRAKGHIVRVYGAMERYITLPDGDETSVLALAHDPIRPTLRAALRESVRQRRTVVVDTPEFGGGVGSKMLRITAAPLEAGAIGGQLWLLIFEAIMAGIVPGARPIGDQPADLARLESELLATKREQQSLVEQLGNSNEELKAANEHILAMNQELQSTNEELTTSKEELQSMNEELTTLNSQLEDKVHALTEANDDLANLLISTDIATVFLDTDLRVKRFTTAACQVLNLRSGDIGRPLNHIAPNLVDVDVSGIARMVLERGTPIERDVVGRDGRQFMARALPYRSTTQSVRGGGGVVVTIVDVTTLKRSETQLHDAREQLREELRCATRLHSVAKDMLLEKDLTGELHQILSAALDITGADLGNIQLADERDVLTIAVHSGFSQAFLDHFARVDTHTHSVCAYARTTHQRVIIEDVRTSPVLAGTATPAVLEAEGVRAVQSTPLFTRAGVLVGMLSTHYRTPHVVDEVEARWLDLLATRAAFAIQRARLEDGMTRAQQLLRQDVAERTRDLQDALDGARAGTWHIDVRARTVMLNERSAAMLGSSAVSYVFDPTFPEVHPDDRARLQARFEAMQTPGDDHWDLEFRVGGTTAITRWIHAIGRIERDADGHPTFFHGINLDVTDQKMAEAALAESRRQEREATDALASLFAAASEGILTHDARGTITAANTALHEMFGYAPGELVGTSLEQLLPERVRSTHAQEREAFWAEKSSRRMGVGRELVARRKDGTTFPIEVSLTLIRTPAPDGRVFAFVTDTTERRRAEDEVRRSRDQLQHRTEQLRRLASDLTVTEQQTRERLAKTLHDGLQQILYAAKLRLDRASKMPDDAAAQWDQIRDDLDKAIAAARTLSVELFPPVLNIGGLLAAIRWLAAWMKEQYGLTIELTADPRATLDAPDQKDRRTLAFESLRELLFDVVKHAGVDRACVDIALVRDDDLQITVVDEGVGFDPSRVFAQTSESHGWGLFSVRERAELLGGSLQVESAPGRGTRFVFTIPRRDTTCPVPRALRILIADDHEAARSSLREFLAAHHEFEVVGEASTGSDAVKQAGTLQPDAILMDVSMPEMNGIEATRRIHAALPAIRILGLSSQEAAESPHAIEDAGAVGYFTKGDDARLLIDRLLAIRASLPSASSGN